MRTHTHTRTCTHTHTLPLLSGLPVMSEPFHWFVASHYRARANTFVALVTLSIVSAEFFKNLSDVFLLQTFDL